MEKFVMFEIVSVASPQAAKIFIRGNFCREALEVNILKGSASPEHIAKEDKLTSCKRFGSPEQCPFKCLKQHQPTSTNSILPAHAKHVPL